MIPFVVECGDIDHEHLSVFRVVVNLVNKMPDRPRSRPCLTCHEVCDLLLQDGFLKVSLRKVTGRFGAPGLAGYGAYEHSWLEFNYAKKRVIIDPYPWACASGPMMVYAKPMSPWHYLYVEKKTEEGEREEP